MLEADTITNKGLNPVMRAILSVCSIIASSVMFVCAPSDAQYLSYFIGFIFVLISICCILKGRKRKIIGSILGLSLFIFAIIEIYSEYVGGHKIATRMSSSGGSLKIMAVIGIPGIIYFIKQMVGFANEP